MTKGADAGLYEHRDITASRMAQAGLTTPAVAGQVDRGVASQREPTCRATLNSTERLHRSRGLAYWNEDVVVICSSDNIATDSFVPECACEGCCQTNRLKIRVDRESDPSAEENGSEPQSIQIRFSDDY